MPRASVVPVDDAVAVVEKFLNFFLKESYPPYSSQVWKDMSKCLGGRWTPHNVYTNVKNNRRSIVAIAHANKNIPFNDKRNVDQNLNNTTINSTVNNFSTLDIVEDLYDSEEESAGLEHFKIRITQEQWKSMQEPPVQYGNRTYPIFRRGAWTDILSLAIFRQTQLPCAFTFKNSKVYVTPGSRHYARVKGHCKSAKCGNQIFCYVDSDPGDTEFDMIIRTRDTMYEKHEDVKRPLRGLRRQQVGQAVFHEGCGNWQKQEVLKEIKFGERVPMHIPNLDVLRQSKMEYVNNKLKVQRGDEKDIVNTIEKMKHIVPYNGFIHEVRRDKFYVSFGTPAQLHAYKQYCKISKPNATISVDGTGSIVKPLVRYDGSLSGHIFLYSVVINFDHTTLAVYDLLTESQGTDVFVWWLNHWQKLGAPKPAIAVCDSSRALMNALSLSFNYQTIKTYVETCFLYAIKSDEYYYRPPVNTYIRLDVAHVMAMIRRWKSVKNMRHTVVRQFFLYCVALMCDSKTIEQFRDIFKLTCTVALHEFQDSQVRAMNNGTVSDARKKLESYIATRNVMLAQETNIDDREEISYGDDNEDNLATNRSRIKNWINELVSTTRIIESQGTEPNSFYFHDFIDQLLPVAYEFPLWTGVALPHEVQRGTSTFSEGHFNDLKHRVLRNYPRPLRADKFLKLEFEDNSGSATILTSKLRNFNQVTTSCPCPSTPMKENEKPRHYAELTSTPNSKEVSSADKFIDLETEHNGDGSAVWASNLGNCNEVVLPQNSPSPVLEKHENTEHQVELTNTLNLEETFSTNTTGVQHNKEPNNNEQHLKKDVLQQKIGRGKGVGKYFRPQPDIEHRNNRATDTRKSWLLRNGNCLQYSASMNGNFYFAYNTCTWDSMVQILANGAMDDPQYLKSLEVTTNDTLKFVQQFIKAGPSAALYRERIRVLKRLFPTKITANCDEIHALSSYSIDLWDNIAMIWKVCFTSDPSAIDSYHCLECGDYASPASTIYANHKIIGEQGFEALQHALELYDQAKLFQCINENCSEICTVERKYGIQVFIELDIRPNLSWNTGVTCQLRALPVTLQLGGHQYRLVGIAARIPGHFIAYCKRGNNIWELCNDLNLNVVRASPTTVVEPHGAIYTKILPINEEPSLQTSPAQKLSETQNFAVKVPFNDSDVTSQDNWRNKGSSEQFCYGSEEDENNNLEDLSEIIEAHKGEAILIDGEPFQVLGCCCLTE